MGARTKVIQCLPDVESDLPLSQVEQPIQIYRDPWGIPHVWAQNASDAFFAQGVIHAQDRLWHMEYDRQRARGRWAEYAGPSGVASDRLMRRMRLEASAQSDYHALSAETRHMLDRYSEGVNAYLSTVEILPFEFHLLDVTPEPWRPWDSLLIFKLRHVLMGVWEQKLFRAKLFSKLPHKSFAALMAPVSLSGPAIIPTTGDVPEHVVGAALQELLAEVEAAGWLAGVADESNNWVIDSQWTQTGAPLLGGDPHRALDTPNVYYQNHLACSEFDVIGLSFPGIPAFPHFGHSEYTAWCITHAGADYQDLFVESFDATNGLQYRVGDTWQAATVHEEVLHVRGAPSEALTVVETHHGPVIAGDPAKGWGLAFQYTATTEPNTTFESFLPMMEAETASALREAVRPWVDPCNNFVFADVAGHIGYQMRGRLPQRSSLNAWFPVPGWTGAHDWQGYVPFDELPFAMDPPAGWIVTANNRIVGEEYPHYIALDYGPSHRAKRIIEMLQSRRDWRAADLGRIHADIQSEPARAFVTRLQAMEGDLVPAHLKSDWETLLDWEGAMSVDEQAPTLYSRTRDLLTERVLSSEVDLDSLTEEEKNRWIARSRERVTGHFVRDDRSLLPIGMRWEPLVLTSFEKAVESLEAQWGTDRSRWLWGEVHGICPTHPLSQQFPEAAYWLDPPERPMAGDADTVQAAGYVPGSATFTVSGTATARYMFDVGDWSRSRWVVPLGSSGHPGSPHYVDQLGPWSRGETVPMLYDWEDIRFQAETIQRLYP